MDSSLFPEQLAITPLYAGVLGLLLVWLSARIGQQRVAKEVSLGDGGHPELLVAQRAQGNFIEYVPMALLLLALVELGGYAAWVVHTLGAVLVVARVSHPLGLAPEFGMSPLRGIGALGTWGMIAGASGLAIWTGIGRL